MADSDDRRFDYESIPNGYYDRVLRTGNPIRRLWHISKFERVLDYLPEENGGSLLDVGCFAGSFLSMVPRYRFERQVGVDILPGQVKVSWNMAEGHTRAKSGNSGVCMGTSASAGTDMITGLYSAIADSIPILCITG